MTSFFLTYTQRRRATSADRRVSRSSGPWSRCRRGAPCRRTRVAVGGAGGEPHDVGLAVVAGEELAAAVAAEQPMNPRCAVEAA